MKGKEFGYFKLFIYALILIVAVEAFLILRSVFDIKSGNSKLKSQLEDVQNKNQELEEENKVLKLRIEDFQEPKITPPEVPEGFKVFRNLDFGFEIAYPSEYKVVISPVEGSSEKLQHDQILTIYSKDHSNKLDIFPVNLTKYKSLSEYIKGVYGYKIYVTETVVIKNVKYDIYKMSGDKQYYVLLKGKNHIYDINSSSLELLKRLISGFKFI